MGKDEHGVEGNAPPEQRALERSIAAANRRIAWMFGGGAALVLVVVLAVTIPRAFLRTPAPLVPDPSVSSAASVPRAPSRPAGGVLKPKTTSLTIDACRSTAIGFVAALAAGDVERAYKMMSSRYRAAVPADAFASAVRSNPYLKPGTSADFMPASYLPKTDLQDISGVLNTPDGQVSLMIDLIPEQDVWAVTGLVVGGLPAMPGYFVAPKSKP